MSTLAISSAQTELPALKNIDEWITDATKFAAEDQKQSIIDRFVNLKYSLSPTTSLELAKQVTWTGMAEIYHAVDPDGAAHRQRLAELYASLACDVYGAPYVARSLFFNRPYLGDAWSIVLDRMKAARPAVQGRSMLGNLMSILTDHLDDCPGVAGFTEYDWRRLKAIKPD